MSSPSECSLCKGRKTVIRIPSIYEDAFDYDDGGTWRVECPHCSGTGNEPEEAGFVILLDEDDPFRDLDQAMGEYRKRNSS